MNNREYLYSLVAKPGRLDEWFEEEHVDVWDLREELEAAHAKNRSKRMHIQNMQNGRHYWHDRARRLEREFEKLKGSIVRCRDCTHYIPHPTEWRGECNLQDDFNEMHWLDVTPDDFCSKGERREVD